MSCGHRVGIALRRFSSGHRSGPTNGSDSRLRLVVSLATHRPPGLFPPTGGAVAAAAPPQMGDIQACRVNRPWQMRLVLLSPLRVFLPINDLQTVPLKGTKTYLQSSQHRHRDIGGVTFLKRACNDIALAGDTILAFGDEPISLR